MRKLLNGFLKRDAKTELEKFLKDDKPNPLFWNEVLADIKPGS